MRAMMFAAFLLPTSFCFADKPQLSSSDLLSIRKTNPASVIEIENDIEQKLRWIVMISDHLHLGYTMPKGRPEIFLVSRAYIRHHAKEICFTFSDPKDISNCAEKIFGWIDDDRRIFLLREEDVLSSEIMNSRREFPVKTWVGMELLHELVHYVQMEDSPYAPSTLPCSIESRWESEAHKMMQWWLNSLQTVDAGRITVLLRGGMLPFSCANKEGAIIEK